MSFDSVRASAGGSLETALRRQIRDVPDFPKPGIVFKDITPVLLDAQRFCEVTDAMAAPFRDAGITHVFAIESRGFILGAPVAQRLGAAFVPIRKPGKLPCSVERVEYALEYGVDALECHRDAIGEGSRVLVADDVLATGGTAAAACCLASALGAEVVGVSVMIELSFLNPRKALVNRRIERLITY
jgi:adenine phosphoribosyltransferase